MVAAVEQPCSDATSPGVSDGSSARAFQEGRRAPFAIDVGCGPGRHTALLQELGYQALGLDADEEMCETARANGVPVVHADLTVFSPPTRPRLVVCWGVMMVVPEAPAIIAAWQPEIVIADWRTAGSSCFRWPENEPLAGRPGWTRLRRTGHPLDGCTYRSHTLDECEVPGYRRIHWQRVTRVMQSERNEWLQTVHVRS